MKYWKRWNECTFGGVAADVGCVVIVAELNGAGDTVMQSKKKLNNGMLPWLLFGASLGVRVASSSFQFIGQSHGHGRCRWSHHFSFWHKAGLLAVCWIVSSVWSLHADVTSLPPRGANFQVEF